MTGHQALTVAPEVAIAMNQSDFDTIVKQRSYILLEPAKCKVSRGNESCYTVRTAKLLRVKVYGAI